MNQVLKLNSRNKRAGKKPVVETVQAPIRLDLGCGPNKKKTDAQGNPQAWVGVDSIEFPGVDEVVNLAEPVYKELPVGLMDLYDYVEPKVQGYKKWPWEDNSVEEIHCSHCFEHFKKFERWHVMNEMYRVLKPGAKATIIVPHWSSCRAYGDMTHEWPPASEFFWYYVKREWRGPNAPHDDIAHNPFGMNCNFEVTWGFSLEPGVQSWNQERQQYALMYLTEARQDMIATLTKC